MNFKKSIKHQNKKKEKEQKNDFSPFFIQKTNLLVLLLFVATFLSWSAWGIVINKTSPFISGKIAIPLFYISFFLAIASSFALFSVLFTSSFSPRRSPIAVINTSIRQGIILSGVLNIGILFQQFRILTWWAALLLLSIGLLIEIFLFERHD